MGSGDYSMRIWLDPQKVARQNLTASDVVGAIREQNVQVAAGVIGGAPMAANVPLQLSINAQGRLKTEDEFRNIVVKTSPDGAVTHRATSRASNSRRRNTACARCSTISRPRK